MTDSSDRRGDAPDGRPRTHRARDGEPTVHLGPVFESRTEPVLHPALARIRRDPLLLVPFLLVGLCLLAIDRLRVHDSLPTTAGSGEWTVTVAYAIYPTGATATHRPLGALVDLEWELLVYGLGLEALAVLAVAVGGWATMTRASGGPYRLDRFGWYLGFVSALTLCYAIVDEVGVGYEGESLLVALGILAVVAVAFVRLFLVPVVVVREGGLAGPIRASWRRTSGRGLPVLALLLPFGLGAWALSLAPVVGTVLSTAIVGSVHAVSLVVLDEYASDGAQGSSERL